ncbi:MAG: heme biosynthesis HemY N-terminal domain-containing protein [Pseudomonadales bacterium]
MKRTLLYLLVVVVIAGVIGTLAKRDPGYVLVSYDGATLQTGLWVFLAGLFLLAFAVWLLLRLWRGVFAGAARLQQWRKDRGLTRSLEHTSRGLLYLQEGNPQRAEKFLTSGIKKQPLPAINYLHLAKAADAQNHAEDREKYLRLAITADSGAAPAVAMARAELALAREDWSGCLTALKDAPSTDRALLVKKSALLGQGDWQTVGELLPALKKIMSDEAFQRLQHQQVLAAIRDSGLSDEQKLKFYRSADDVIQRDAMVMLALAEHLSTEKELEVLLRKAIKRSWQPELVEAYGELGPETAGKRLKVALAWQKQHPIDPSLSYCLGRLQEHLGKTEAAKTSYSLAVEQAQHRGASKQLASLLAAEGNFERSHELLQLGYRGA